jgi:hypothetical protein
MVSRHSHANPLQYLAGGSSLFGSAPVSDIEGSWVRESEVTPGSQTWGSAEQCERSKGGGLLVTRADYRLYDSDAWKPLIAAKQSNPVIDVL